MAQKEMRPAPTETKPGDQMDDNVDDLGNKPDGTKLDQPTDNKKPANNAKPS